MTVKVVCVLYLILAVVWAGLKLSMHPIRQSVGSWFLAAVNCAFDKTAGL